jgi:hypothetical protein
VHYVGQFVDRGEVLRALPGVVADFEDRVGDEPRRDDSLGTAATPARCPGPHTLRPAWTGGWSGVSWSSLTHHETIGLSPLPPVWPVSATVDEPVTELG